MTLAIVPCHSKINCYLGLTSSGLVKVVFPFDAVTNSQLKKIRPRGRFLGVTKGCWYFPLSSAQALRTLLNKRFVIKNDLSNWIDLLEDPLPVLPSLNILIDNADLFSKLVDGREPLEHQCSGARWLISKRRALLADEMGLGKTLTVLLAARAIKRSIHISVMVIAPAGLHSFWLNEANILGVEINLYSWESIPKELSSIGTLLIVDEAHFAQSINTKRTRALLRLSRHPRLRFLWLLTGTPMKNGRTENIYTLLIAMNNPIVLNQDSFKKYFGELYSISKIDIVRNLDQFRELIQPFILHRKKSIFLDFPPKVRFKHQVELSSSEKKGLEYRIDLSLDNYRKRVLKGLIKKDAEALIVLNSIRQITAEYKLREVLKFLKDDIGDKKPVVIFSNFVNPLLLLNRHVNGHLLTGRQTIKQREKVVDMFQSGRINLLLCSYKTAAFGFTLHRARNVILLDRPWSPGDLEQAEDRCHRLGSKGELISHWFQLGFADEFVDSLLSTKNKNIEIVFKSDTLNFNRTSISAMASSLLQEISNISLHKNQ